MTPLKTAAFLLLAAIAATPTANITAEIGINDNVLTVTEVARLLRVPEKNVIELAESGSIPARRIGEVWRFNRAAVMAWLQGKRPLEAGELAELSGGSDSSRDPQLLIRSPTATKPYRPIGEAPVSRPTAEEVARRDQGVLLSRGSITLEPGLSYARQTRENFPLLRLEQSSTTASLAVR